VGKKKSGGERQRGRPLWFAVNIKIPVLLPKLNGDKKKRGKIASKAICHAT
jgi:hypothetical protein